MHSFTDSLNPGGPSGSNISTAIPSGDLREHDRDHSPPLPVSRSRVAPLESSVIPMQRIKDENKRVLEKIIRNVRSLYR